MTTMRIGQLAVRWITASPRAREELRHVEPMVAILAGLRLLDASFEGMVARDPGVAHAVADMVDAFHERLSGLRDVERGISDGADA
jgi:hypothetical protein